MQQVHRVNNEGAVGGVLTGSVWELLLRAKCVGVEELLPLGHLRCSPVTINATDGDGPVLGRLREDLGYQRRLRVVAVDEQGHVASVALGRVGGSHGLSMLFEGRVRFSRDPIWFEVVLQRGQECAQRIRVGSCLIAWR